MPISNLTTIAWCCLGGGAVLFVTAWLVIAKFEKRLVHRHGELAHPAINLVVGAGAFIASCSAAIGSKLNDAGAFGTMTVRSATTSWPTMTFCGLALLSGFALWRFARQRHVVSAVGLLYSCSLRGRQWVRWADVRNLTYSRTTGRYKLRDKEGRTFSLSADLDGWPSLAGTLLRVLPETSLSPTVLKMLHVAADDRPLPMGLMISR